MSNKIKLNTSGIAIIQLFYGGNEMKYINTENCYDENILIECDKEYDEVVRCFDEKVQKAFKVLRDECDYNIIELVQENENEVCLIVRREDSYKYKLILETALVVIYTHNDIKETESFVFPHLYAFMRGVELTQKDNMYTLGLIFDSQEAAESCEVEISFANARTEITLFDYSCKFDEILAEPWTILANVLYSLEAKSEINMDYLNDRELELLPIATFAPIKSSVPYLTVDRVITKEQYSAIMKYIKETSYTRLEKLVDNWYNCKSKIRGKKFYNAIKRELESRHSKELWRAIYRDVVQACEGYVTESEYYMDADKLRELRRRVSDKMYENGMIGTYPNFYCINEQEDGSTILGQVLCNEYAVEKDCLYMDYLVGTVVSTDKEQLTADYKDIVDILFTYSKKRGAEQLAEVDWQVIMRNAEQSEEDTVIEEYNQKMLDISAGVAAKTSMHKKLTDEEKQYHTELEKSSVKSGIFALFGVCIACGGVIGIIISIGSLLIKTLSHLFTRGSHGIVEVIFNDFWLMLILMLTAVIGIVMFVGILIYIGIREYRYRYK